MGEEAFLERYRQGFSRANDKIVIWLLLLVTGFAFGEFVWTPALVGILYFADANFNAYRKGISPLYLVLIFSLGMVMKDHLGAFAFISLLYAMDVLFNVAMRFFLRPIYRVAPLGFELVLFNTVIVGYAFGPIAGVITGLLFGTTYYGIIFGFGSSYQFVNIPAYAAVGYLAGTLSSGGILGVGMALATAYAVGTSILIYAIFGGKPYKAAIFVTTNLLFNYWLFSNVSTWVLAVIGA